MTTPASFLVEVPAAAPASRWRAAVRRVPGPLVQVLVIASSLYLLLEGWRRDIRMPIAFSSDSVWYLAQAKSTIDNGWWWWNPRLGAPFGLDEVAFPSNSTVDQAIVWLVSRGVSDAFAAVNLAWLSMVVLSGLSATWCTRALGVSRVNAVVAGTLFALSPYALYRHIDHFALAIYLVPFACAAALWLAAGKPHQRWGRVGRAVVFGGCALLGLNYVYYAFFASFCIAAGALIGYLARWDRRLLATGALCLAIIGGTTLVNLSPSFYSWSRHGRPLVVRDKVPAESEIFGLKIRQLVSPVFPHRVGPFHAWVEREAAARFPGDNENWTTRLGLVGTVGFLALLTLLFIPDSTLHRAGPLPRAASRLVIAALLLATVGGFGSLFNLFIAPDIRAYNRIAPFIAFCSLLAVAVSIDRFFTSRRAKRAAALVVLVVGLADQGQAARRLNDQQAGIAEEVSSIEAVVRRLEHALPANAMVLQLPFRAFMSESDFGRMKQYNHFKPYLVSRTLRFSYPALSNAQVEWQLAASRLDIRTLTSRLAAQGFSAVLIDRSGYEDDGAAVTAALLRVVGGEHVLVTTDRYVAVDITAAGHAQIPSGGVASEPVPQTLSLAPCTGPQRSATLVRVEDQVNQIGASFKPFEAAGARVQASQSFKVSGWAVDPLKRSPAAGVDLVIDRLVFPSTYGTHRDDVAEHFRRTAYRDTGFTGTVPADALAAGEHWLSLRVVASDGGCYYQSPGFQMMATP